MYINLNIILCIVIDISNVITALILMESALWKAIQVNSHLQIEETTRGRDRGRGGCGCGGRGHTSGGVAGKTSAATPKKSSPVKQKQRYSRSSSGETEEQKASRLALSRQCKEKAKEIQDENTIKEDDLYEEESTSPSAEIFRNVAKDIHQAVKEDLQKEGIIDKVANSELRQHIKQLLKAVLGMKTVSKSKVDDVLFLSESETDKKSESSENEKMQSAADKTPEPKLTSCDVLENE